MSFPPPPAPDAPAHGTVLPRWARVVDASCLILVLLAVIVAEWGGFRERVGGVRIALTSPYRIAIAALVLAIIRHAIVPRPPIWADLPARLAAGFRAAPARAAWTALVGTRPAI